MDLEFAIERYVEQHLAASAAGYPGANDDIVTYTIAEMMRASPNYARRVLAAEAVKAKSNW